MIVAIDFSLRRPLELPIATSSNWANSLGDAHWRNPKDKYLIALIACIESRHMLALTWELMEIINYECERNTFC